MKQLILVRGIPGSGKSTFAQTLGGKHIETDMFFNIDGDYHFDGSQLKRAHNWCRTIVCGWMSDGEDKIVVSNTFSMDWEMQEYFDMAKEFGYQVFSIIMENRHDNVNTHQVPNEVIEKMRLRFEIKL